MRYGGDVWKSNPPPVPRRNASPALKTGKVTGPLSPPSHDTRKRFVVFGDASGVRSQLSGAGDFERGGLLALHGCSQFIQGGIGAHFVVGVIRFLADFSVGLQLAREAFS
jgi:hypothetical protein